MPAVTDIFHENTLREILHASQNPSEQEIERILEKGKKTKGISLEEAALLLHVQDEALWEKIFHLAREIKESIYGERIVFFAPLYISSYCVNDCDYCGFHARNLAPRKKLALQEVEEQARILIDMGHKRLLLEFGEHPLNTIDYVCDVITTIYGVAQGKGEIRRANVNIAATTVEDYAKLKEVGIGTYQLFQETYHRETYETLHKGPKADYERQLFAHDRAFAGGLDDIGLGVLFGLYDYKFEVLALLAHAEYLDTKYGVGPHTISVPRFQPAESVDFSSEHAVSEEELLKIIAILRIAVPYTGMIISTRERPEIREKAFKIGISQTSAGSQTDPGGYRKKGETKSAEEKFASQFQTADHRSLDEVVMSILDQGLLPSFCTACYREGRTGEDFMDIAKPGEIHNLCRPNALLTFQEYLEDYASEAVKKKGIDVLQKYLEEIENPVRKKATINRLERIRNGERDLYF